MSEVEVLTLKINSYKKKLNTLIDKRKEICPHENIKRECSCDDDFAYSKDYTYTYECLDCGKYGSSKNPNYKLV